MTEIKNLSLQHGYFFAPGFYRDYWVDGIQRTFGAEALNINVKLKQHREVWVGSIFAAIQTKVTGKKHFVGISPEEPPDVLVVRYVPITTSKGSKATKLENMPIEITRCNMDYGEDVFIQILKKNKPAYSNLILLVYIYGCGLEVDMDLIRLKLGQLDFIYPSEIIVLGSVQKSNGVKQPNGTFISTRIYPKHGQDLVNIYENSYFFTFPPIMKITQRGISQELKEFGSAELTVPRLD